jgi:hypothetical protein
VTIDGKRVIEYRGALTLPALPKSMVVIGAGAIGVEFASFYHALGVELTLVEYMPTIVPLEDDEISQHLERSFKKRRIRVMTGTQVTGAAADGDGVRVSVANRADPAKKEELRAEVALMAVGPHRLGGGHLLRGAHRGDVAAADRLRLGAGVHVLPPRDRVDRAHREGGEGAGRAGEGRALPVHRARQGARAR